MPPRRRSPRYRVIAVRHRGQRWESKWHYTPDKAVQQATRWHNRYPELLALSIENEHGDEYPIPAAE